MEINYILIVLATIAQFVLGALWYSPLMFGKWWMEIMGATVLSKDELAAMQRSMLPFYGLQLFLTFFLTVSFANLLPYVTAFGTYHVAFWVWIGFIVPTQIGMVIWGNTKKMFWCKQIVVTTSYQFVALMLMSWILSM